MRILCTCLAIGVFSIMNVDQYTCIVFITFVKEEEKIMDLSRRLQCIADEVLPGSAVADIGTDHGYVPIYLYLKGKIRKGIAMDIGEGPLARAKKNIQMYEASSVIETRRSNGLEKLEIGEVDTIIIAGMGGLLIQQILEGKTGVLRTVQRLILQPQRDQEKIRRLLHKQGFKISNEQMINEEGHYYTIITAIPGQESYQREVDYLFGRKLIEEKSPILKEYICDQLSKYDTIINNIQGYETEAVQKKKEEAIVFQNICKEVLQWL